MSVPTWRAGRSKPHTCMILGRNNYTTEATRRMFFSSSFFHPPVKAFACGQTHLQRRSNYRCLVAMGSKVPSRFPESCMVRNQAPHVIFGCGAPRPVTNQSRAAQPTRNSGVIAGKIFFSTSRTSPLQPTPQINTQVNANPQVQVCRHSKWFQDPNRLLASFLLTSCCLDLVATMGALKCTSHDLESTAEPDRLLRTSR